MTDWKKIFEEEFSEHQKAGTYNFIAEANESASHAYVILHDAGGWVPHLLEDEPVTEAHAVRFLGSLVEVRTDLNRRQNWRSLLELVAPDYDPTFLIALYERETGLSDDQAFPLHLDPDEPEGAAVLEQEEAEQAARDAWREELNRLAQAAQERCNAQNAAAAADAERRRLARRRPLPLPKSDPTLQIAFDLPLDAAAIQSIVQAHVTAWLTDGLGRTLPSFVKAYGPVRKLGDGRLVAWVRLFDDAPAAIYVEGAPKKRQGPQPFIRQFGRDFFFHGGDWAWQRFLPGETREAARDRVGHHFY